MSQHLQQSLVAGELNVHTAHERVGGVVLHVQLGQVVDMRRKDHAVSRVLRTEPMQRMVEAVVELRWEASVERHFMSWRVK